MRLVPLLRLFILALFAAAGSVAAMAQPVYQQPPAQRDLRAYPPGYYPGKLVQPAPRQGFSIRRFLGTPEEPSPARRRPAAKSRKPAPPPAAVAKKAKPKVNPSTHVVVFGDSLASYAHQGLDDLFAEDEDIAVVSKVRGDSSLVRSEPAEWPDSIRAALDEGQKITLAVIMLGYSDRHALKEGGETAELLSKRWEALYRQRVEGILRVFQERQIPVVWIGLPPVKNSKASEDLVAMNEIYRESVQRFGGAYVDVWPGFVDEDNRYTATGPDVDGEKAKLRASDGVSFTKAGARKLAHFADADIRRILEAVRAGTTVATAPPPGEATTLEAALPPPPDAAVPVVPEKPVAGPVLPLTRPDVAPGGTLVSGTPKLDSDQAYTVQRALRNGIAPGARPGRADDFRWPRS